MDQIGLYGMSDPALTDNNVLFIEPNQSGLSKTVRPLESWNIHSINQSTESVTTINDDFSKQITNTDDNTTFPLSKINTQSHTSLDLPRFRSLTLTSKFDNELNSLSIDSSQYMYPVESLNDINPKSPTYVLSDLLISISSKDLDEYTIVSIGNELVVLFQQNPSLKYDISLKNFISKIQFMFYHKVSEVRASGYRLLRYIITDYQSLQTIIHAKILIFIIVTMNTNYSNIIEKEQALKLIRHFLTIENGCDNLSIGVIKSIISIIELKTDDNDINNNISSGFKLICLETICEISLLKPELIFHSGAFKIIIDKISEGNIANSTSCLLVLLNSLDQPFARKFLRNGYDFISLISVFSDDIKVNTSKLQAVSFLLTILLKNFNGLMAFLINNFQMLHILLSNLRKNNVIIQDYIMDIIFDVLRIKSIPWLEDAGILDSIDKFHQFSQSNSNNSTSHTSLIADDVYNQNDDLGKQVLFQYQGLLIRILLGADLMTSLGQIIQKNLNENNTKKANSLIVEIYTLAQELLPPEFLKKKTLLPKDLYINLQFEKDRRVSHESYFKSTNYHESLEANLLNIVVKSRFDIDDLEFRNLIDFTKILTIKEFEKWNWYKISNLIQGPLHNPKRFDEILEKNPRVLKRLMSFYRPFKFRFSNVGIKEKYAKEYINVGCQLFKLFLSHERGVKYLASNKILPQMAEIVCQLNPASGITAKTPLLSAKRLESTIVTGYIKFIGILSTSEAGLKVLQQWQFFQILHNLVETCENSTKNNTFMINLFKYIDFSFDSPFKIILAKTVNIANSKLRLYIFHNIIPKLITIKDCQMFIIKILVERLYDSNLEVVNKSIDILSDYFAKTSINSVKYLIDLNPPISIIATTVSGRSLLMHLLKSSHGFRFLHSRGFIDNEFNNWKNLENFNYLMKIEHLIRSSMFPVIFQAPQGSKSLHYPYFFKYLLATEDGYVYFSQQGYLDKLLEPVTDFYEKIVNKEDSLFNKFNDTLFNSETIGLLNTIKQNLWIIGNIGSGKFGIQLLDPISSSVKTNIISIIIDLCNVCPIWQIRGICFYVLGMIASTVEGIEILDEMEWTSVLDHFGNSRGVVYPKDMDKIFNIKPTNPYRDIKYYSIFSGQGTEPNDSIFNDESETDDEYLTIDNFQKINDRIILLINNLNSVLGKIERKAEKELLKMKTTMPMIFQNISLFLEVIRLIDKGNFDFKKRNFVLGLFISDSRVLEGLVKRKRDRKDSPRVN